MKQVIILKGLPGSGKSTYARTLIEKHPNQYKRINNDDLRSMLDNSQWSRDNEKLILKVRDQLILMALESGKHVVVDNTNLASKHETHIRELVKGKAEVVIQDFTALPIEECIRRDLQRPHSVGEKVIRDMWRQFLAPAPQAYVPPPQGTPAIICDLDGTLALLNGRDPYNASTCLDDLPNQPVIDIVKKYSTVVYVSGREDKFRTQTLAWLSKHGLPAGELFMRKTGDMRKDSIVKREIFDEHIRDKYRVLCVLDDRLQVCRMWYSLGLPLLRVGDPDADF